MIFHDAPNFTEITTIKNANDTDTSNVEHDLNLNNITSNSTPNSITDSALLAATLLVLISGLLSFFLLQDNLDSLRTLQASTYLGYGILVLMTSLLLFRLGVFIYHIYLFYHYKAVDSVEDDLLPTSTIIVPAYNEGPLVYKTIQSLVNSNYPANKLEIITIDDGSKDDTWDWILKAKQEFGDRITIFQQPENMGKRHALYRGFHHGSGEVFITVDSDSVVLPDTLRNLVSPLVVDLDCGAVAGNVAVLNQQGGIIPKMLGVSFVMSFEFKRSAESTLGSVLCTPGALAAYRKTAVMSCLEQWINQQFRGKPSDIGEDRAMTNMILAQGLRVVFQRNALVYTNVPEMYSGLTKMFIRWGRSNVREHLNMGRYVFKDFRGSTSGQHGTRLLFIDQSIRMILMYPLLIGMLYFISSYPFEFLGITLASIMVITTFSVVFYAFRYRLSNGLWAYAYSLLFSFGLFWIAPYSMATAAKGGWLTRELK